MKTDHVRYFALVLAMGLLAPQRAHATDTNRAGPDANREAARVRTPPAGRFMVHLNVGINVYTYAAPSPTTAAMNMMPTNRLILLQQAGFGYWVHPNVRLQLTLQFAETVTGLPATASPMTLIGAIPWVVYTNGIFFAGAGPLIAARSYGQWQPDVGVFTAAGVSVPVGAGFGVGAALQVPIMFLQRFSIGVSPAIFVAKRF